MTLDYRISCENNYTFKSYEGSRKKLKKSIEQHDYGDKITKNARTELERAFYSLNLDYFIHYSQFFDEDDH